MSLRDAFSDVLNPSYKFSTFTSCFSKTCETRMKKSFTGKDKMTDVLYSLAIGTQINVSTYAILWESDKTKSS